MWLKHTPFISVTKNNMKITTEGFKKKLYVCVHITTFTKSGSTQDGKECVPEKAQERNMQKENKLALASSRNTF